MTAVGKNRIMIYGPKNDGTYVIEFKTVGGEALAISIDTSDPAFPGADAVWAVRAGCGGKIGKSVMAITALDMAKVAQGAAKRVKLLREGRGG